jgi:hypothetical protein
MAAWRNRANIPEKSVEVKFTLWPDLMQLIRTEAAADEVSQAQIIRRALRLYFTRKGDGNA